MPSAASTHCRFPVGLPDLTARRVGPTAGHGESFIARPGVVRLIVRPVFHPTPHPLGASDRAGLTPPVLAGARLPPASSS